MTPVDCDLTELVNVAADMLIGLATPARGLLALVRALFRRGRPGGGAPWA